MNRPLVTLALALVSLSAPPMARAWWNGGHMRIAAAAYERLTPRARAEADRLIRLNPDHAAWIAGLPEAVQAESAFVIAATWPDDIKDRPGYVHDTAQAPTAGRNIGYADRVIHTYWHFVELPFSPDHTPVRAPDAPNALSQMRLFTATLASGASDALKSYDLVWVIHLVGDIHQPLHATSRFSARLGDDAGGHKELVEPAGRAPIPLRLYWDGLLGDKPTAAEAIAAARLLPPVDPRAADIRDPAVWAVESFALAQNHAYADFITDGTGPFPLTPGYEETALDLSLGRAALAGARLANLLNCALGSDAPAQDCQ